jgi:heme iron utilization protein
MAAKEWIDEARTLIRGANSAALATQRDGQPFASLVTPAPAPDLSPLLLISTLAEHTRHLKADPRCALMYSGTTAEANPQTAPRVSVTGIATPVPEDELPALKARWLARHPYGALYAGFADFSLWRVAIGGALLVGGFGRAQRLRASDLAPDADSVAAIAAAEADIIAHVNTDHPQAVAVIAERLLGREAGAWRLASVDVDGCDISDGNQTVRLAFAAAVRDADGVRAELVRAAREARSR